MTMSIRISAFPAILLATLAACGGGGGGGSVIDPGPTPAPAAGNPETAFASFSAIRPNQTVVMSGISQTGSGTDSAFKLDPLNTNSTAKLSYNPDRELVGMSMITPQSTVDFGYPATGCFAFGACSAGDGETTAVMMNAYDMGWNYQSFGVWAKNATTFQTGALSAGVVTPASAVPTIGSATFTGHAGGFYLDGAGNRFATDAQMSAVTNFANRSIEFSTTGTLLTDTKTLVGTPNSNLDLRGNWNYAPGTSQFSGSVNTVNNGLSGSATGRFYGPSAQEIGGVYGLTSPTGASMVGGFGGKRLP
jgi:hypothetical protein